MFLKVQLRSPNNSDDIDKTPPLTTVVRRESSIAAAPTTQHLDTKKYQKREEDGKRGGGDALKKEFQVDDRGDPFTVPFDRNSSNKIQSILNGEYDLIDVRVVPENFTFSNTTTTSKNDETRPNYIYTGVTASFCGPLNWTLYKDKPQSAPMYQALVMKSPTCRGDSVVQVDLLEIMQQVYIYDDYDQEEISNKKVNLMDISGFIFHQSRCGSTWVSNMLQSMDTTHHRVYSEPDPPAHILIHLLDGKDQDKLEDTKDDHDFNQPRQRQTSLASEQAIILLKDVVYLMRRTNNAIEKRMFVKFQSTMSRHIDVIQKAFPDVPWLFLYRDSVEVMMSYLGGKYRSNYRRHAYCQGGAIRGLPPIHNPPSNILQIVNAASNKLTSNRQQSSELLSYEGYCAANIATVTNPILDHINKMGFVINYDNLPTMLYTRWQQSPWNLMIGQLEIQNMNLVSTQYSKQLRGSIGAVHAGAAGGKLFENDSLTKESEAWDEVKEAASTYLQDSYKRLEDLAVVGVAAN